VTGHWLIYRASIGALVWELAAFSIYVFNGAMDVQEDRVNGSRRPIASGTLARSAALRYAAIAAVLSLAGAGALGVAPACIVAAVLVIGWQYSGRPGYLKRRPAGTAAVGGALGLLAYLSGYAGQARAEWLEPRLAPLIFVLTMSAWMAFVGAPSKDLPDVAGDAAAGRRTLPLILGETRTRRIIAIAAIIISIEFSIAAVFMQPLLRWPAVALAVGTVAIVPAALGRIWAGIPSTQRTPYLIFMFTQYTVNICLFTVLVS
jgi:4-hydroxybenzoate polyprenyltransferase